MAGIFELAKPSDLLQKLNRELERLRRSPGDADHAFNFFVTAEHLLDWIYPGSSGKSQREALRNGDPLLELISHIASGAKHFDKLSTHHRSMSGSKSVSGYFSRDYWPRGWFGRGYFSEESIEISVTGPAAKALGSSTVTALDLAQHVLAYWSAPGRIPN